MMLFGSRVTSLPATWATRLSLPPLLPVQVRKALCASLVIDYGVRPAKSQPNLSQFKILGTSIRDKHVGDNESNGEERPA